MERKWSLSETQNDINIGNFLDHFDLSIKNIQQIQQKLKKELEDNSKPIPDEKSFGIQYDKKPIVNKNEKEQLYIEALYTIKHRIGRTIDGHSDYINDLNFYLQDAFKIASEDHERLMAKATEEKAPALLLNVEVVEARNLEAKDANGFSDPYCMLGIVPGNRNNNSDENSASDDDNNYKSVSRVKSKSESTQKSSFIRRLSSFRRSDKSNSSIKSRGIQKAGAIKDGQLPAKYIQTTDVKKATLNPVWMEKFRFKIDNIDTDMLHLDIWDHDDEFSVFEAAKKLNEIKGFKGLDRYFKQIAQSARTNKTDKDSHVDDFLGAININLNNIPSNGIDKWYDLEGRTERSNVEGQIRLKLSLSTREDRGQLEDDTYAELKQHEQLMEIFIDHEILKFKGRNYEWNGELSKEAETILHQHAIQGDLTEIQLAVCRWIAYSKKHLEHQLSYKLILKILEKFDSKWKHTSSTRDEIDSLRESFTSIINHCCKILLKLRDIFPVNSKLSLEKLEYVLKLLNKIYMTEVFKHCCPFQNSVIHEVSQIIKTGSIEWFDKITKQYLSNKNDDDCVKKLVDISNIVILDCYISIKYYKPIFEKELNFQYLTIVFKKIDHEFSNLITKCFYEEFGDELAEEEGSNENCNNNTNNNNNNNNNKNKNSHASIHSISSNSSCESKVNIDELAISKKTNNTNYGVFSDQTALYYFELYVLLFELIRFKGYIEESNRTNLQLLNLHKVFVVPLKRWLELIKIKLQNRIEKLFEIEKSDSLNDNQKYSQSCLELSNYIAKIGQVWTLIDWPDKKASVNYSSKLYIDVTKLCVRYATILVEIYQSEQIMLKVNEQKDPSNNNTTKIRLDLFKKCCIFINNIEKIRDSLYVLQIDIENSKYNKNAPRSPVDKTKTLNSNDSLLVLIDHLVENMIKHQLHNNIESNLFYFNESSENTPAQESISRLLKYLDSSLVTFKDYLTKFNFQKALKFLWIRIIDSIKTTIKGEKRRSLIALNKINEAVNIIFEFLNADNQGLDKETLSSCETYKDFKRIIKIAQTDTNKLILLYYQEMAFIQNSMKSGEFGKIYCRSYYHTKDETLIVEVIKCKNLIPMDQNGLSDPYVEVEIKPKYVFSGCHKQTTSIIKKNLNPVFEEKFEFKISEKLCLTPGAVIHFTVMDHDLMWANDFEGEAFLELSSVPGIQSDLGDGGYSDLKYVELWLIHPKNHKNKIWDELELRTYDKIAVEFVKLRKEKIK